MECHKNVVRNNCQYQKVVFPVGLVAKPVVKHFDGIVDNHKGPLAVGLIMFLNGQPKWGGKEQLLEDKFKAL
jgi:hypothetical protein